MFDKSYGEIELEMLSSRRSLEDLEDDFLTEVIVDCGYMPESVSDIVYDYKYNWERRTDLTEEEREALVSFYVLSEVDGWEE